MNVELLTKAKSLGFSDRQIAHLTGTTEDAVRAERNKPGLAVLVASIVRRRRSPRRRAELKAAQRSLNLITQADIVHP